MLRHIIWMIIVGLVAASVAKGIAKFSKNRNCDFLRTALAAAAHTGVCWAATDALKNDLAVISTVFLSGVLIYRFALREKWAYSIGFSIFVIAVQIFSMRLAKTLAVMLGSAT